MVQLKEVENVEKIAGINLEDSQCLWIHLWGFTIFVDAFYCLVAGVQLHFAVDTCDRRVYVLLGNYDTKLCW